MHTDIFYRFRNARSVCCMYTFSASCLVPFNKFQSLCWACNWNETCTTWCLVCNCEENPEQTPYLCSVFAVRHTRAISTRITITIIAVSVCVWRDNARLFFVQGPKNISIWTNKHGMACCVFAHAATTIFRSTCYAAAAAAARKRTMRRSTTLCARASIPATTE